MAVIQFLASVGASLVVTVLVLAAIEAAARRGFDPVRRIAAWVSPEDVRAQAPRPVAVEQLEETEIV